MFSIYITILFILCYIVSQSKACDINGVTDCNQIQTVNMMHMFAFIPPDKWADQCKKRKIAIDCIYQDKYIQGCKAAETFFYDMQKSLARQVCSDGEYTKHGCIASEELDSEVHEACLKQLEDIFDVTCDILESVRACVSSKIEMRCGVDDGKYVDRLAYYYFKPYADILPCQLEEPTFIVPTTSGAKEMSHTTESTSDTATTDEEEDGDDHSGHSHKKHVDDGTGGQPRLVPTLLSLAIQIAFVIFVIQH